MKYQLSANQNKLLRHYKLYPNDPSYNLVFLYKIMGKIDRVRLKVAIEKAYNSIHLFKINFEENGEELFQNFIPDRKFEVDIVHREPNEFPERFETKVIERARARLNAPIDLFSWPLLQFTLYCSSDQECYLAVSGPHIVADGLSYTHLIHKINQGVQNLTDWEEEKIPDFHGDRDRAQKDLEFFQQELPSSLDSLELKPIKQKRNGRGTLDGTLSQFKISQESVQSFLNQYKYSESSFFLAIHALFLKKLTDETRIVIGLPVLNRNKSNKNAFGYFVNTLPLVLDFNEILTFQNLIDAINKKILRLLRHQSFDVSELRNIDPNFTNYFTYYDREFNYSFENCSVQRIYLKRNVVASEFVFTVEKREKTYMLCVEAGDFFQPMDVAKTMQALIDQVVAGDYPLLREIPLTRDEVPSYLRFEGADSIASAFEKIAYLYPDHIAVNDFKTSLTYNELDRKSNQIARFLAHYAKEARHILISPSRTNDLVALILGILKAGKCYVPIDKFCPNERFQYIRQQLGTSLVIGDADVQGKYQIPPGNFISMVELLSASHLMSRAPLRLPILSDALAYIIYTSGTTGNPKGVQVSQKNLLSLIDGCFQKFSFSQNDVWTLFHSYSFDFSVWEIFGCLLSGGKLLIIESQVAREPPQFYSILSDCKVTVLNQTPTAFRELVRSDQTFLKPLQLRYVIFGGEALCFPNLKEWVDHHPLSETKLINMYGITETTIHVTYYEIQPEDLHHRQSIIGKPLPHLGVRIVNSEGQTLPQGLVGEIAIFGEGVSCGYYQAKELTEKKFVSKRGQTLYLSGDMGKVNQNGDIVFLGRKDRQVQIRGFRVELDEIEYHLLKTGLVQQCAMDALCLEKDSPLRIIAYLIPKENFSERAIREKIIASLPFYMIPSYFCCVEAIPLTINGKVDFRALKSQMKLIREEKLENTSTEQRLYQIVSDTIKKGDLSMDDNFWDLGVNSIDLATIFFKVKAEFAIELSMADLFLFTTMKKLAAHIDALMNKAANQQEKIA